MYTLYIHTCIYIYGSPDTSTYTLKQASSTTITNLKAVQFHATINYVYDTKTIKMYMPRRRRR